VSTDLPTGDRSDKTDGPIEVGRRSRIVATGLGVATNILLLVSCGLIDMDGEQVLRFFGGMQAVTAVGYLLLRLSGGSPHPALTRLARAYLGGILLGVLVAFALGVLFLIMLSRMPRGMR
jgi:hypothetical protein